MCDQYTGNDITRRSLVLGAVAAAGAATLPLSLYGAAPASAQAPSGPAEALERLRQGNERYVSGNGVSRDYSVDRVARSQAQAPFAAIVGCADSRLAPEIVFDQGLGDLFVVRVAGNFVNEDSLASLEFGTAVLGSKIVLVLGHSSCGAIAATIDVVQNKTTLPGHLHALTDAIASAVERAMAQNPADLLAAATAENVRLNVEYLKTAAPLLSDLVAKGQLDVVGGVYELATGKVALL